MVPYILGMPGPELFEQSERGEVVLGGCCVQVHPDGSVDDRACRDCHATFVGRRRRPQLT